MIEEKQKQHKIILILIYFNLFFLLLNRLHNRSNIRIVGQLTIWMPFWHCCRNRSGIMFQHLEHACIFHISYIHKNEEKKRYEVKNNVGQHNNFTQTFYLLSVQMWQNFLLCHSHSIKHITSKKFVFSLLLSKHLPRQTYGKCNYEKSKNTRELCIL